MRITGAGAVAILVVLVGLDANAKERAGFSANFRLMPMAKRSYNKGFQALILPVAAIWFEEFILAL